MAFHRRRRLVGLRVLRRTPAFFIAAVLTLGLGVGVITTAYSVLDAAIIAALPFKADSRLIRLYHDAPAEQGGRQNLSLADFLAVRDKTQGSPLPRRTACSMRWWPSRRRSTGFARSC